MWHWIRAWLGLFLAPTAYKAWASPVSQVPLTVSIMDRNISLELFTNLEELSRIVDISYCVGTTGIQKPFQCASRCQDFNGFELVTVSKQTELESKMLTAIKQTWETGSLLSDSCGYLVIDHSPSHPRIILAFRGTYSIANAIVDLSTIPQEYVPYPGGEEDELFDRKVAGIIQRPRHIFSRDFESEASKCDNCTVHAGFMISWRHTRSHVIPHLEELLKLYPQYQLTLVGHSLGGAVAALASLDFRAKGWKPQVTTFGEPRIGNDHLVEYLDKAFSNGTMYRRVTHVDDPVPLLPLDEWGYRSHAGEIYISKPKLTPKVGDLQYCYGDADPVCIAGAESAKSNELNDIELTVEMQKDWLESSRNFLTVPSRFQIWQLFFAHRDYFWRLGLCLPYTEADHSGGL